MQWYQFAINENIWTADNGDVETEIFEPIQTSIHTHRGDDIYFAPTFTREVLFEDFEIRPGVVIPAGDYRFQSARFHLTTTHARPVRWNVRVTLGEFFNGDRFQLSPSASWQPNRYIGMNIGAAYNDIELPGGEFETIVTSGGIRLTPNPRLS